MDAILADMFEEARKIVREEDRRIAEEEERQRDKQREAALVDFSGHVVEAFDFTSKEKMELGPRLDIRDSQPFIELVARGIRAVFVLSSSEGNEWNLVVVEEGCDSQPLGVFKGGDKGDGSSRRLAAARVVTAIGNWAQKAASVQKAPAEKKQPVVQSRWQAQMRPDAEKAKPEPEKERPVRREPTYGTFGKFLGY